MRKPSSPAAFFRRAAMPRLVAVALDQRLRAICLKTPKFSGAWSFALLGRFIFDPLFQFAPMLPLPPIESSPISYSAYCPGISWPL
jgi:hypothetical protein